jgi:hypothetical protein
MDRRTRSLYIRLSSFARAASTKPTTIPALLLWDKSSRHGIVIRKAHLFPKQQRAQELRAGRKRSTIRRRIRKEKQHLSLESINSRTYCPPELLPTSTSASWCPS